MKKTSCVTLALPKGRMYDNVSRLMMEAGFSITGNGRNYRPICQDPAFELKVLKPQNLIQMVALGSHDLAFAGFDWIVEQHADVVELIDTGLDPVRIVAAAPNETGGIEGLRGRRIVVASEYENLTRQFLDREKLDYHFVRSYGATEVFPPDDADLIVDNTATGRTLIENGLSEIAILLNSSTRIIANPSVLSSEKRQKIDEFVMLIRSVLDARQRVMLEMNVSAAALDTLLKVLPCMRYPTVSELYGRNGFAVKAAVPRREVARLIPQLKTAGATDILEYPFSKVVL